MGQMRRRSPGGHALRRMRVLQGRPRQHLQLPEDAGQRHPGWLRQPYRGAGQAAVQRPGRREHAADQRHRHHPGGVVGCGRCHHHALSGDHRGRPVRAGSGRVHRRRRCRRLRRPAGQELRGRGSAIDLDSQKLENLSPYVDATFNVKEIPFKDLRKKVYGVAKETGRRPPISRSSRPPAPPPDRRPPSAC